MLHKNESLRSKNFELFQSRYSQTLSIDPEEDRKYRMIEALNGEYTLEIIGAAPYGDLRMNSIYNPSYEAFRWGEKFEVINRRTSVMMLGFSTGIYIRALMNKLRPDSTFYILEPEEGLFSYVCSFFDLSDLIGNNRIRLYVTDNQKQTLDQDILWELSTYRPEVNRVETPFYASNEIFDRACTTAERFASSTRSFQREKGRRTLQCRLYAWNHMQDAVSIVDFEKRIPKDIPAIIVASGPSLEKNVEVLSRLKGHAFIICVDRSVSLLEKYGIVPDIVTSIDSEKSPDFLDSDIVKDIPLLCTYQLNDATQRKYRGRCIYYYGLLHERVLFGDKSDNGNGFDHGGNVAGSAFSLCRVMGIKTIILMGQDLAYLGDRTHAVGSDADIDGIETLEIDGIDGKKIKSNVMWVKFRDFYERQIRLYPELRVINATEGGAMIHGAEVMTLSEVADDVCINNFGMDDIFADLPKVQTRDEYMQTVKVLTGWMDQLDTIMDISKKLVDVCRQIMNICKDGDVTSKNSEIKLDKMDELRNKIYSFPVNTLLEEYWIKDMYSIPDRTFVIRNNDEAVSILNDAIAYYSVLPKDCKGLKKEIARSISEGKRDYNL